MRFTIFCFSIFSLLISFESIAEEWRIGELISDGQGCRNRFVVVIRTNFETGESVYEMPGEPEILEFKKAESWIKNNYPGKTNNIKFLIFFFGKTVSHEFQKEEDVFEYMRAENSLWMATNGDGAGCEYFEIKRSGKSFSDL